MIVNNKRYYYISKHAPRHTRVLVRCGTFKFPPAAFSWRNIVTLYKTTGNGYSEITMDYMGGKSSKF